MRVLVSGVGIAGTAAALYLIRDGHSVTLVDHAPAFRHAGYALSLKNFGVDVMRDLGLEQALLAREIPLESIRIRSANGRVIQSYSIARAKHAAGGAIAVSRADLHEVLVGALQAQSTIRFGVTIGSLETEGARALVRMSDGEAAAFDLVVVAEGVHSTSRALIWPDAEYRPLGVVYVAGVIDAVVEPRVVEVFTGLGAQLGIVPIDARRALVYAYLRGELGGTDPHTAVPGLLRTTFRDHDAATLAGVEALGRSDALFVDAVGLVHVPTLARGRAVLLGDAGYCPTFLSGMGASLGLIGAAALDRCLREAPMADALARYDQLVRPMSEHFQRNARGHVESLLTSNPLRRWATDAAMHLLPPALLEWSFGRQFGSEAASVRAILGS